MKRLSRHEVLALLAVAGVAAGTQSTVSAADSNTSRPAPLQVQEHPGLSRLGSDSACGAGACGADDKGAAAARKKHAKDSANAKQSKPSTNKKSGKSDKKKEK